MAVSLVMLTGALALSSEALSFSSESGVTSAISYITVLSLILLITSPVSVYEILWPVPLSRISVRLPRLSYS